MHLGFFATVPGAGMAVVELVLTYPIELFMLFLHSTEVEVAGSATGTTEYQKVYVNGRSTSTSKRTALACFKGAFKNYLFFTVKQVHVCCG